MTGVGELAAWVVGVGGAVTILGVFLKKIRRSYKRTRRTITAFSDAILGREEIVHPDTGAVLVHAVPGMGTRMTTIEDAMSKLADSHHRWDALEIRVTELEVREKERMLARTESIELMRTIDAAIKADPTPEVE